MFKLIALIVISINGQSMGDPLRAVNRATFETAAACQEYAGSEKGKAQLEQLNVQIVAILPIGGESKITTQCEPVEDNTI